MDVSVDCIELENLSSIAVLSDGGHFHILQKCIVCLENQGHSSPVKLKQYGFHQPPESHEVLELRWSTLFNDQWRKSYADLKESVEDSAKGVAFLLMRRLGYDLFEQAARGTRVDYYMSKSSATGDDTFIFNGPNVFGLEISGILNEPTKIQKRLHEKKDRIINADGFKPSIVVVVEHSAPQAAMEMVS